MTARLKKEDPVEAEQVVSGAAYYLPATVVSPPSLLKKHFLIEHETQKIAGSNRVKEYMDPERLRPVPPRELNRRFMVGDEVDAFREDEGCWVKGTIREILEDSRYHVGFNEVNHPDIKVDHFNLRLHLKWDDGTWVPPFPERQENRENQQEIYAQGEMVEVTSDEQGYKGSWYSGFIFKSLENGKFVVEYLTLKMDDDESLPQREVTEAQNLRPCPPSLSPIVKFKHGDEVDAWFNEGWWVGSVSKVLKASKYIVYFSSSHEELKFPNSCLRLHQDWINGQWLIPPKGGSMSHSSHQKPKQQKLKPGKRLRTENEAGNTDTKFTEEMKVEVRSDEKGYEGAWYTATIVNYKGNMKYMVEYHTLTTDDEMDFLREEVKASDIRPCPPPIRRAHLYDLYEHVDAWFNEGWWAGQVRKIFTGMKYTVYFETSNEELEFAHSDLRPHQEWKNGEWIASYHVPT